MSKPSAIDHRARMKKLLGILVAIYLHPLNAGNRLGQILNFLRWQLSARLLRKKVVVDWVDDARFISSIGEHALTGNQYLGLMEYEDMGFLLHALRAHHTFVDVGANCGSYTILATKVVGARTVAFEPIPATVERLLDQIHLNRIRDDVTVRRVGVGAKPDRLRFTVGDNATNRVSSSASDGPTIDVEVARLDDELPDQDCIFLKIDVEGFEYAVVEGARQMLSSERLIAAIVEFGGSDHFGHSFDDLHRLMCSHQLLPVAYDPMTRKLRKLDGYNRHGRNTIYVKDCDAIQALCTGAPSRTVHTARGRQI